MKPLGKQINHRHLFAPAAAFDTKSCQFERFFATYIFIICQYGVYSENMHVFVLPFCVYVIIYNAYDAWCYVVVVRVTRAARMCRALQVCAQYIDKQNTFYDGGDRGGKSSTNLDLYANCYLLFIVIYIAVIFIIRHLNSIFFFFTMRQRELHGFFVLIQF